ncbi:galactose-3-O-sulfotransferase 3-like [Ylistrum balloti]|uniref:galactose-3-O-sulfotransferase 3-like n=1 Tax=Ylistrum balloti TaxID=509963 RepID=UPI002905E54D|nr:galactose-3-O-sulfotransferase 3-like [Ylistrum balloti]
MLKENPEDNSHLINTLFKRHDADGPNDSKTSVFSSNQKLLQTKKERRHIAFLKVHKAASSTAQNIFLRFALKRDLLVVLPFVPKFLYPNVISSWETVTDKNILPVPRGRVYEILCCHAVYNKDAFERIMPADTINIGIVREPFEHFKSTLNYIKPREVFNLNISDPVSLFLQKSTTYQSRTKMGFVNNRMAFEFNFPADIFKTRDKTGIETYLQKLDREFQLVIIVEMFDESLILMRRLLNWGIKDILYIKLNAKKKLFERITFKPGDVLLYKKWAELDYALYHFFFRRLQVQIHAQGGTFYEELLYYRSLRQDIEIFCEKKPIPNVTYHVSNSRWSDAFEVAKEDCAYMEKKEIPFIKEIRMQQYGFYNDTI